MYKNQLKLEDLRKLCSKRTNHNFIHPKKSHWVSVEDVENIGINVGNFVVYDHLYLEYDDQYGFVFIHGKEQLFCFESFVNFTDELRTITNNDVFLDLNNPVKINKTLLWLLENDLNLPDNHKNEYNKEIKNYVFENQKLRQLNYKSEANK